MYKLSQQDELPNYWWLFRQNWLLEDCKYPRPLWCWLSTFSIYSSKTSSTGIEPWSTSSKTSSLKRRDRHWFRYEPIFNCTMDSWKLGFKYQVKRKKNLLFKITKRYNLLKWCYTRYEIKKCKFYIVSMSQRVLVIYYSTVNKEKEIT